MKNWANSYSYEISYNIVDEESGKFSTTETKLKSNKNNRRYNTKMTKEDLPEYYCDVQRYGCSHDVIKAKDIRGLKYTWIKENHFMKDSILRISYVGEIQKRPLIVEYDGESRATGFNEYLNVDEAVFGYSIFKFLAYVKKYSDYDISEIKSEFLKHCKWLKSNEPLHAPSTDNFSKWFDDELDKWFK